jgi:hypothetical protein
MMALDFVKGSLARKESLILIIQDTEAQRVLAAWQVYTRPAAYIDFVVGNNSVAEEVSARLWKQAPAVDFRRLSVLANVPETRTQKAFNRVREAYLLWPDGTVSPDVARLLRGIAQAHIDSFMPKTRRTPYEPTRNDARGTDVPQQAAEGVPAGRAAESGAGPVRRGTARKPGGKAQ